MLKAAEENEAKEGTFLSPSPLAGEGAGGVDALLPGVGIEKRLVDFAVETGVDGAEFAALSAGGE